jgi:DNA-binding NarL/FixJ family response regulator
MTAAKVSVLLVEDHRLMFEGLSAILSEEADLNVVGVATTMADAVEKSMLLKPDLVLMDYRLPDGDGAQATQRIRAKLPETVVVFLSAESSESAQLKAVQAGASGFVSKAATAEDLVDAIRRAAQGELLLEAATMARVGGGPSSPPQPEGSPATAASQLTRRECEVLALLARGMENSEIAAELGVTNGAVRSHVRAALQKLGAHTRAQGVAAAEKAGVLRGV